MPTRAYSASLWPALLTPKSVTVTVDRPIFKGPKPLAGREQTIVASAGGWQISYGDIIVGGATRFLTYRQIWMETVAAGLPVYVRPDFGPHTAKTRLNITSSPTNCTLNGSHTKGATTLNVTNASGYAMAAGDYIELNGRIYIIRTTTLVSGNNYTWTIWPPLRGNYSGGSYTTTYASGTQLEIQEPRCLMYIVPDSRSYSMTLTDSRIASVSLDFIEASW